MDDDSTLLTDWLALALSGGLSVHTYFVHAYAEYAWLHCIGVIVVFAVVVVFWYHPCQRPTTLPACSNMYLGEQSICVRVPSNYASNVCINRAGCCPHGALHRLARQLHHGRTLCPTSPGLPFLLNSGPGFGFLGEKVSKRRPPCLGPVLAGSAPWPARRGWGAAAAPSHGSCRILPSTVLGVFLDLLSARTKDQELGIRENTL